MCSLFIVLCLIVMFFVILQPLLDSIMYSYIIHHPLKLYLQIWIKSAKHFGVDHIVLGVDWPRHSRSNLTWMTNQFWHYDRFVHQIKYTTSRIKTKMIFDSLQHLQMRVGLVFQSLITNIKRWGHWGGEGAFTSISYVCGVDGLEVGLCVCVGRDHSTPLFSLFVAVWVGALTCIWGSAFTSICLG